VWHSWHKNGSGGLEQGIRRNRGLQLVRHFGSELIRLAYIADTVRQFGEKRRHIL
jgi:hypothetical protein